MSQSLVEFCLLTYACEAWQGSRIQKLRKVGKSDGPILSRLWARVHEVLRPCRGALVVSDVLARLSTSCFVPKIFAIRSQKRRKKRDFTIQFLAPDIFGRDDPDFLA